MIQWCTHHKDDPPPPEDDENKEKRTDDIPVWDQEFLKVDQGTLFELILVSVLKRCKGCACEEKLCYALEKYSLYASRVTSSLEGGMWGGQVVLVNID